MSQNNEMIDPNWRVAQRGPRARPQFGLATLLAVTMFFGPALGMILIHHSANKECAELEVVIREWEWIWNLDSKTPGQGNNVRR